LEGGRVARERRARSRLDTRDELRELARCRALNPDDGDGLLVSMRRGLEPSSPALYASEERKSADPNAGIRAHPHEAQGGLRGRVELTLGDLYRREPFERLAVIRIVLEHGVEVASRALPVRQMIGARSRQAEVSGDRRLERRPRGERLIQPLHGLLPLTRPRKQVAEAKERPRVPGQKALHPLERRDSGRE